MKKFTLCIFLTLSTTVFSSEFSCTFIKNGNWENSIETTVELDKEASSVEFNSLGNYSVAIEKQDIESPDGSIEDLGYRITLKSGDVSVEAVYEGKPSFMNAVIKILDTRVSVSCNEL